MFTHAPKVHTFAAWVQPGGAVIRRRYAGGICRFRGNSSNRNHSATGSLSMRTWVFLQTRISVPVFSLFRQWSQRGRARTTCFPFSDNFALPEDSKRCCGWSSPEFAGMVHGNVSRPAAARKQLRTSLTTATFNMLTIWAIKTKKEGDHEQPQRRRDGFEGAAVWAVDVVLHKGERTGGRPDSDTCCCSWYHCLNFPIVTGKHTVVFLRRLFQQLSWAALEEDALCAFYIRPAVYLPSSGASVLRCQFGEARQDSLFTPPSSLKSPLS